MTGAYIFCIRFLKIPIYLSYKPEGASLSAAYFPKGIIWISGCGQHFLTLSVSSNLRTHDSAPLAGFGAWLPCVFPAWTGVPLKGRRELALQTQS